MISGMKCSLPACDRIMETIVGFKKPVAKVNVGGGSTGNWWATEAQIEGVAVDERYKKPNNVVTLVLAEDRVSRLHGIDNGL